VNTSDPTVPESGLKYREYMVGLPSRVK